MERRGYYELKYGGQYMPEVLMNDLDAVEREYEFVAHDGCFVKEHEYFLNHYEGRNTPLYLARLLSKKCGPDFYFKREDLGIYGSSRSNHIAGQMIIGKRIGKKKALTTAPTISHALSTASLAAAMEMQSEIFIGAKEALGEEESIQLMTAIGAKVHVVSAGEGSIFDAEQEAKKVWVEQSKSVIYIEWSALGPHPYPKMVQDFQKVTGQEAKEQLQEKIEKLPKAVIVSVGTNPTSLSLLNAYREEENVSLIVVEPEWNPVITKGQLGIFSGMLSLFLQDEEGNLQISDKSTYPGAEPMYAALKDTKRVQYVTVSREETKKAAQLLLRTEGILPSVDSACALAYALKLAPDMQLDDSILLCLSETASASWQKECME